MTVVTPAQLAADIAAWSTYTRDAAHLVTVEFGARLQVAVKRHAAQPRTSPRPSANVEGPRLMTGDYNRSINRLTTRNALTSRTEVGTNKAQGARLEFGFTGVDAKGRNVNQQPYPHFGPGIDEVQPEFEAAIEQILAPPGHRNPTSRARGPQVNP